MAKSAQQGDEEQIWIEDISPCIVNQVLFHKASLHQSSFVHAFFFCFLFFFFFNSRILTYDVSLDDYSLLSD